MFATLKISLDTSRRNSKDAAHARDAMPQHALIFITRNGLVFSASKRAQEPVAKYIHKPVRLRERSRAALLLWVKSNSAANIESDIVRSGKVTPCPI
jgi:hypothetical protein